MTRFLLATAAILVVTPAAQAQRFGINLGGANFGSTVNRAVRSQVNQSFKQGFNQKNVQQFQRHLNGHVQNHLKKHVQRNLGEQIVRHVVVPQVARIMSERRVETYHTPYCHARPVGQPVQKPLTLDEQATLYFNQAQAALQRRDYSASLKALDKLDQIVKEHPDALQFRSLVYFAQGRYREASRMAYEAIARGPGWNWTTLRTLFGSKAHYTEHYLALKQATKNNPESVDFHFLLGYHYLMLGHLEHGRREIQLAQQLLPNDELLANLLAQLPEPKASATPATFRTAN